MAKQVAEVTETSAPKEAVVAVKNTILPFLRDLEVDEKIKANLTVVLNMKGFQDPKTTALRLGQNLFPTMRDVYLEVDPKGDPTRFTSYYQKASV